MAETTKDLIFDEKNFNKGTEHGKELMTKSFSKWGAGRSILADKNLKIIAGNKSTESFNDVGYNKIQVVDTDGETLIVVRRNDIDLDTPEGREFALADNQTAKVNIDFDFGTMEAEIDEGILEEWGIENPEEEVLEAEEDDFDTTPPEEPITVLGDLYEIGEHRLFCGSSTETDSWLKVMNGQLGDLVVTDPPYNVDYTGKTKDSLKIENDKKTEDEFYQFLYDFYTACASVMKAGGAWYVWHADSEGANFRSAMANAGIMVKQCLIWVKNSMVMGRQDYHWQHEPCLYGWKEGAAHGWYSDRKQTTVLHFDRPQRNGEHPTMKPIALISYQIENSSKNGDIVVDGFLGSGSTMVAAHQLKRKCFGQELDPKYCDVIVNRMLKLDPKLNLKRNGVVIDHKEFETD